MGAPSPQVTTQEVDPDIKGRQLGLYSDLSQYYDATPYQTAPTMYGEGTYAGVAGLQPFQQAAQSYLGNRLLGYNPGFQTPELFGPFQTPGTNFGQNPAGGFGNQGTDTQPPVGDDSPGGDPEEGGQDIPNKPTMRFQMDPSQDVSGGIQPTPAPGPAGVGGGPIEFGPGQMAHEAAPYSPFMTPTDMASAASMGGASDVMGYTPERGFTGIGNYMNPYEDQVVGRTVDDMARAEAMFREGGLYSKPASTYGGDRQAIQESTANRDYLDRVGNVVSQLRSQGFDTAAQHAQTDASRALQGQGLNLSAADALNRFGTSALSNTLRTGSALNQVGAQNQGLAQSMVDSEIGQFYEARNDPLLRAQALQGILTGLPVGMSTSAYPGSTPGAGFAGGALSGASIGSAFGPWGAGIGALGGGLLGLF